MAEVVLFHHIQGLTDGVLAFADRLRAGGHHVHTPDLFDGEVTVTIEEGAELVDQLGPDVLTARADRALDALPSALVYAGVSFGAVTAQRAAQVRPGARGVLLYEGCLPVTGEWAVGPWPAGLPVQVHGMDKDPYFALEGDIDAAQEIVDQANRPGRPGWPDRAPLGELFVYPGDAHLFTDSTLPSFDADATTLVVGRSLEFLDRVA